VHGFLALRTLPGETIADSDLIQNPWPTSTAPKHFFAAPKG
jgi:hypothetical protein